MDLKSTLNICHTCLSPDRKLYSLTKFRSLIQLNFLLKDQTASVCWECKNAIKKFCDFITKALTAQKMMDAKYSNKIVCLSTLGISKQQLLLEYTHLDDPLTHRTDEIKCIKKEEFNSDTEIETYNEDSEQINKTNGDFKSGLDNILMGEENDGNELEPEKRDIEIEIADKSENELIIKIERDEHEEVTSDENFKSLSNINNKLLNAPEEVTKNVLIVELTDEEVKKQREQKRRSHNFTKSPYKCDFCIIGFTKEENFNEHVKKNHSHIEHNNMNTPRDDYSCDICKVRLKSSILAQKHRERHYIQYKCRLCKYETCYEWAVLSHSNRHNNDVLEWMQWDPRSLISSTPIEKSETQHCWTCEVCGYEFRKRGSLRAHIRRTHPNMRKFACDNCSKTFNIKSELEFHMISHDADLAKRLLYCKICNVKFKSIYTYKNHMKQNANHRKERFPCSECNKQFVTEKYRKKHFNFYHLKKSDYSCDECKRMFITKFSLKQHQQIHHGLNRPRNHVCNICGKKFHSQTVLKGHQLIHSEQRSYMCSECGDTFKQPSALYLHTKLVHKKAKKLYRKQKNTNL